MINLLQGVFQKAGVPLSERQAAALSAHAELLFKWNRTHNLTRIVRPRDVAALHFLDSAAVLWHAPVPNGAKVADIGSGAGFPGLVAAVFRPDLRVSLIEASAKKAAFLETATASALLPDARVLHVKISPGRPLEDSGEYDLVLSRYTGSVPWLGAAAKTLLKPGGWLAAHKFDDRSERLSLARLPAERGARRVQWTADPRLDPRRRFAAAQF